MKEYKIEIPVNQEDVQKIINCYEKDLKELKQLQNNWNEFKNWLEEQWKQSHDIWFVKVIGKMQEMEQGKK